jgi:hypothetical protein
LQSKTARRQAATTCRAAVVLALSLGYLSYVFQLSKDAFWKSGIGNWLDPYFINFLLEHWHHSLVSLSDPHRPPCISRRKERWATCMD